MLCIVEFTYKWSKLFTLKFINENMYNMDRRESVIFKTDFYTYLYIWQQPKLQQLFFVKLIYFMLECPKPVLGQALTLNILFYES
jgi:hypothetical protein